METSRLDKLRASFSVLSTWEKGDYQRAIDQYLKIDSFETPQMKLGKNLHQQWEQETQKTKCLPKIFGGKGLVNPTVEQKLVVEIAPWLDFVFIVDCLEDRIIHEYKSGANDSSYWINTWQIPIYGYGLLKHGISVNKGYVHTYNPYNQRVTHGLHWLTEKDMQQAVNTMWKLAKEMWDYIQSNRQDIEDYWFKNTPKP